MRIVAHIDALLLALVCVLLGVAGCDAGSDAGVFDSPAPAGSRLPHLANDPAGRPVLSWVQEHDGAHQLKYAVLADDGWTAPTAVAQGEDWLVNWADFPAVHPLDDELWAAHWLVKQPGGMYAYDIAVALSRDGGRTWGTPFRPHRDGTPTEHGFVSMWPAALDDGGTGVGMVWLDGRHMLLDPSRGAHDARTVLRSAVFDASGAEVAAAEVDDRVCDCCQTALAPTPAGPLVAYRDRSADEVRDIHVATRTSDGWQASGAVAADGWVIEGCPVNGPAVDARAGELAVAWYTEAGGRRRVEVSRGIASDRSRSGDRSYGGVEWATPLTVDAGPVLGRVDVALLDDGDAAVSWLGQAAEGSAAILLVRVGRDGGVGEALRVASVEASRPAGFPQVIRHGDALLVAWTDWREGVAQVKTARIPATDLQPGRGLSLPP